MGKKKIITKEEIREEKAEEVKKTETKTPSKNKVVQGIVNIEATFNNTKVALSDKMGNILVWSSSGAVGFKGTKKGTPFAASKVGEIIAEKAAGLGVKEVEVVVKGVGSGRESVIRSLISKGLEITAIKDRTPVPHNGPKPPKPRRV